MTSRYRMTADGAALHRCFGVDAELPEYESIAPNDEAPVILGGETRRLVTMRWGWPSPGGDAAVTTVRNLASPFWRAALRDPGRRCLVPATAFAEVAAARDPLTRRPRLAWFDMPAQPVFALAGVWRDDRFAILTTMANAFVATVHHKAMPAIVAPGDHAAWLGGDYAAACALAKACADRELRIL